MTAHRNKTLGYLVTNLLNKYVMACGGFVIYRASLNINQNVVYLIDQQKIKQIKNEPEWYECKFTRNK